MHERREPRGIAARGHLPAGRWRALVGFAVLLVGVIAGSAQADFPDSDTLGATTLEQRVVPNSDAGFRELALGAGEPSYTVREEEVGTAQGGRESRRTSLVYFGQLSDFQLADEESPARVEFIDTGPFSAAWRPWEALNPQIDDAMIRQLNAFASASPVAAGDGSQRAMDFTINTGDAADSQQLNETTWVRQLMEGGPIDPGSGVNPLTGGDATCAALGAVPNLIADGNAPGNYTGAQDFDDYTEGAAPQFYDPDNPTSAYAGWPEYEGLMDRAQDPFTAEGLDVPSYITFGNHDALVQGNAAANALYELVATGCLKITSPVVADPGSLADALGALNPANLLNLLTTDPTKLGLVPPDPRRQFVSKKQYKDVFLSGSQTDGHGFAFIDPAENAASNGAAGYYAWSPLPGFRFISLDTLSEAGVIGPSADGNVDHPQFQWLENELEEATATNELVVLFSHHAIPSLTADFADELAPPCTIQDAHGHDVNPGCDLDPRTSAPIHLGADMEALLHQYPHVIAWVAGHSHVNSIEPHPNPSGDGGFWSIRVAAEADWPQQSRLLEVFDNQDETLSIFGTILDHAGSATAPPPGDASEFDVEELASVGRTIAYNDTQSGGRACDGGPCGEGGVADRNVELLVDDPRAGEPPPPPPPPPDGDGDGGANGVNRCSNEIKGTPEEDTLVGTRGSDLLRGRRGDDLLRGRRGRDCIRAGRGSDRVNGGKSAADRIGGGGGQDRVNARDGKRDTVRCGTGRDRARVDAKDSVADSCEQVRFV
jgi:metallophosphoesterase (TIGR03767 family)